MEKHLIWLAGVGIAMAACSAEVRLPKKHDDDNSSYYGGGYNDGYGSGPAGSWNSEEAPATMSEECTDEGVSDQSCDESTCREVKVFVHYMLTEELGDGLTVQIEAFDNPNFHGSPRSTTQISDFRARTGEWRDTSLILQPGEYYIRAYLRTDEQDRTPYPLGDMELVADTPVGVYGALSAPSMIRVKSEADAQYLDPVHINLDKLFAKPGTEPETQAHLRVLLSTADQEVSDRKKVLIRLYDSTDLDHDPVYAYDLPTEQLLVQGRPGQAEFVTPSLEEGDYIVFAFLDNDDNGFYDAGELAAIYKEDGLPRKVAIRKDRTESLSLALTPAPELPE